MNLTAQDIVDLDRFGDKKAENLIGAIAKSKNTTADRLLFALGIDGIGKKTAKDLIKRFGTIESLVSATKEDLTAVDGIGDVLADNIVGYFKDEENLQELQDLYNAGVTVRAEEKKRVFSAENALSLRVRFRPISAAKPHGLLKKTAAKSRRRFQRPLIWFLRVRTRAANLKKPRNSA